MSQLTTTVPSALPNAKVKLDAKVTNPSHPLDPLSPDEISLVSLAIRHHIANNKDIKAVKFVTTNLILPPKRAVLASLGIITDTAANREQPEIVRRAESDFLDPVTGHTFNAQLSYSQEANGWVVDKVDQLPDGVHPQITVEELIASDELVRKDERVIKLAAEVGVAAENICADGWSIGWDSRWPNAKRLQQCLLYARLGPHENLYAHPLDFIPVVDVNAKKVIHIDFPPHRGPDGKWTAGSTAPPDLTIDPLEASGRSRIYPPLARADYLPDLLDKEQLSKHEPLKPLHIVQPEGVSFRMVDQNVVQWQSWRMHVAFGGREGLVLSTITWDDAGVVRPVFYRLCLAEMVVPYASPEHPHPRKFAFDVGEYGMGTQANELSLGCDCLGAIHYLPGCFVAHDGNPVILKRAICIHEEDAGVLWKHTDYRIGGRAHAVRSRRLVISMVCTVANYEYAFAYHFYLDGTIELEIRLTGIVNTYLLAEGESPEPYGIEIAPRINAQLHQHIFSVCVDPMIDGLGNTVIQSDILPVQDEAGSKENYAGNAFVATDRRITKSSEGICDYDATTDRRWRIVNPSKKHFSSGREVAWGIHAKGAWNKIICAPGAWTRQRAAFAEHDLWIVKDVEGPAGSMRRWPAGKYVPQTRENPSDSVSSWVESAADASLEGEDIVLFLTVGVNHVPRPEDWPVMPAEHLKVAFKPIGFFKENPSLHIAGAHDVKSRYAFGDRVDDPAVITGHSHDNACC